MAQPYGYGAPAQGNPAYAPQSAQNLQFYPSSYGAPGDVSGHATPSQAASYGGYGGAPAGGSSANFGFGPAPGGVSGRMGEQGGLKTGWIAAFSAEGYEGEPSLLEELDINFSHIQQKVSLPSVSTTSALSSAMCTYSDRTRENVALTIATTHPPDNSSPEPFPPHRPTHHGRQRHHRPAHLPRLLRLPARPLGQATLRLRLRPLAHGLHLAALHHLAHDALGRRRPRQRHPRPLGRHPVRRIARREPARAVRDLDLESQRQCVGLLLDSVVGHQRGGRLYAYGHAAGHRFDERGDHVEHIQCIGYVLCCRPLEEHERPGGVPAGTVLRWLWHHEHLLQQGKWKYGQDRERRANFVGWLVMSLIQSVIEK